MTSITPASTEIRPAHYTRAQQTTFIQNILGKTFGVGNYFPYTEYDGIDLYDPPLLENGFPKIIFLPRNLILQWDFENIKLKKCLNLIYFKLDIDTLAYLISLDVFEKVITTHEVVPAVPGKGSTARFTLNCNFTTVQQVRNVFWNVFVSNPIPMSGVSFSGDHQPLESEPWSELVKYRSDPATRVYSSLQAPQEKKTVNTKPLFGFSNLKGLAELAESKILKKEVSKSSVPLPPLKILECLSSVFCLNEDLICDEGKNLHLLKGKEIGGKNPQSILEISRQSMRECIVPTAISTRTQILDFTSCVLEEHALIDLVEYYGDLHVTEIHIGRELSSYELMALAAQKSIIERRNPHFINQSELVHVKKP